MHLPSLHRSLRVRQFSWGNPWGTPPSGPYFPTYPGWPGTNNNAPPPPPPPWGSVPGYTGPPTPNTPPSNPDDSNSSPPPPDSGSGDGGTNNSDNNNDNNNNNGNGGNGDTGSGGETDSGSDGQQKPDSNNNNNNNNNNNGGGGGGADPGPSENQQEPTKASPQSAEPTTPGSEDVSIIVNAAIPETSAQSGSGGTTSLTNGGATPAVNPTTAIGASFSANPSETLTSATETNAALASDDNNNNGGLSAGAIVGIIIALLILFAVLFAFLRRRMMAKREDHQEGWRQRLFSKNSHRDSQESSPPTGGGDSTRNIRNSQRSSFGTFGADSVTNMSSFATFGDASSLVPNMAQVGGGGQPVFSAGQAQARSSGTASQMSSFVANYRDSGNLSPNRSSIFTVGSYSTVNSQNPFSDHLSDFPTPPSHTSSQLTLHHQHQHTPTPSETKMVPCHLAQIETVHVPNQASVELSRVQHMYGGNSAYMA